MKTSQLLRSHFCRLIGADLRFEADVTASPARPPTLEATSDHGVRAPVGKVTVPASGKATLRDPCAATAMFQAYRVRSEWPAVATRPRCGTERPTCGSVRADRENPFDAVQIATGIHRCLDAPSRTG